MGPKFRSSIKPIPVYSGVRYGYSFDNLLFSQGNPKRRGVYTSGGKFLVTHQELSGTVGEFPHFQFGIIGGSPKKLTTHQGVPVSMPTGHGLILDPKTEFLRLQQHGATGWRRARPGNPIANAGQWLAELRDLPRLPGAALAGLRRFRALGSEYLNVQFGWAPFLGDLRKMYQLTLDLDRRLMQLRRDNGRRIRRRRTLVDTTEVTPTFSRYLPGVLSWYTDLPGPLGYVRWQDYWEARITTVKTKRWFVGAFRYYIENSLSPRWSTRAKAALFGLNPTPSLLWEVLPWSWLIGYFTNIGDAISNLSQNAVDHLTADYAYIMEERSTTIEHINHVGWKAYGTPSSGTCMVSYKFKEETKMRELASPYGFGVTYDGLSAYQTSILAALGISRSRF